VNYPTLTLVCGYLFGKILNIKANLARKQCGALLGHNALKIRFKKRDRAIGTVQVILKRNFILLLSFTY